MKITMSTEVLISSGREQVDHLFSERDCVIEAGLSPEMKMKRRQFVRSVVSGGIAAGIPAAMIAETGGRKYVTLEWYRTRRDLDQQRLGDFLGKSVVPAYDRAGLKPTGLFQVSIGPDSPSFLLVAPYPSMAAIQEAANRLAADEKWVREQAAFDEKWDLAYERREAILLRTFESMPNIEVPKSEGARNNIFELRQYESRNLLGHTKKVAMFDNGEIAIFRRAGVNPVFFGSTVFGPRMPNLIYMVAFPSIEARSEAWSRFVQDPEWKKISTAPGNTDRELVSSISNQILSPLAASMLK